MILRQRNFCILVARNGKCKQAKVVNGYTFTVDDIEFGVHRRDTQWACTELSTGLRCGDGKTRKAAIADMMARLDTVKKALRTAPKLTYEEIRAAERAAGLE